jgi:hypothetical protein
MIGIKCGLGACLLTSYIALVTPAMADDVSTADSGPWVKLGRLAGGAVDSVVFDTAHPGVAFAGSDAGLIYRSKDGGATWRPSVVGTPIEGFRAIAVSPSRSGTVYAYSSDLYFGGQGTLYRSLDDGLSWAPSPHQPSSAVAAGTYAGVGRGVVIDPTGRILVLTDAHSGVLRSTDEGDTWTNPIPNAAVYGVSASPGPHGVLWVAGGDFATGLASIWKSTDFGATWVEQSPAAFNPPGVEEVRAYAITVQPGTGAILASWIGTDSTTFSTVGGIVVSTNGGVTWKSSDRGLLPTFGPGFSSASIVFDPLQPSTVYLSTAGTSDSLDGDGLYVSRDGGANWQAIGDRLRTLGAIIVAARPQTPGYPAAVFAGFPDLFVSTDHALTWTRSDTGLEGGFAQSVMDDGFGAGGYYAASGDGLFHSTNGGREWARINRWLGFDGVASVAVDLNSPLRTVYAASVNRVWRSINAGDSWTDVTPRVAAQTLFISVYSTPARNEVFAVTNAALFHSKDAGFSWSRTLCGMSGDYLSSNVLVSHSTTGRLYIGRSSGLWISNDDGASCALATVQPIPGGVVTSIAEAGTNPTALLISGSTATGDTIVVSSTDGGGSYQPVAALPSFHDVDPWALSSAPNLQVALAVFEGSNIAVSVDRGVTWTIDMDTLFAVSAGVANLLPTQSKVFWGDISGALYAAPYAALD